MSDKKAQNSSEWISATARQSLIATVTERGPTGPTGFDEFYRNSIVRGVRGPTGPAGPVSDSSGRVSNPTGAFFGRTGRVVDPASDTVTASPPSLTRS